MLDSLSARAVGTGRPEDVVRPFVRQGHQDTHVRRTLGRRRENVLGRRLGYVSEESLELRPAPYEHLASVGAPEGVAHAYRAEGKPTGSQGQLRVADVELKLALANVEPLVLVAVAVLGRAHARRRLDIEQAVLPTRVLGAGLDRHEGAEQPEVLAFLLAQPGSSHAGGRWFDPSSIAPTGPARQARRSPSMSFDAEDGPVADSIASSDARCDRAPNGPAREEE